jgi:hypothetical protein
MMGMNKRSFRMMLFLALTLLALFIVFGMDVRQKRREFTRKRHP